MLNDPATRAHCPSGTSHNATNIDGDAGRSTADTVQTRRDAVRNDTPTVQHLPHDFTSSRKSRLVPIACKLLFRTLLSGAAARWHSPSRVSAARVAPLDDRHSSLAAHAPRAFTGRVLPFTQPGGGYSLLRARGYPSPTHSAGSPMLVSLPPFRGRCFAAGAAQSAVRPHVDEHPDRLHCTAPSATASRGCVARDDPPGARSHFGWLTTLRPIRRGLPCDGASASAGSTATETVLVLAVMRGSGR
ncbi:uncharacterized protein C8Q71DRAFT_130855 [Rhodofomes roseus]|uniref:Uncharacterized protein n=1 Tax=Rhodofomes roseus TaxID=34475 RepID=A0ABQ8KBH1_9APHY|nr:uncharacterized protein C8Q71DRAFT_130855 [Rhodofomes roseus]KAH9834906.1 hypothetical protein C8Q71DRAFT_130855 [Rhodofomes roseus]